MATVIVQEKSGDLQILNDNRYSLQVAKSVSAPGGDPSFSLVYLSSFLGPTMSVSWETQYGLNWSTKVPYPGAKVEYYGNWQACKPGDSYQLNSTGDWVLSTNDPSADKNSLNVINNYQAVNIIVGMQDSSTKTWMPIYIDTSQLLYNGHGAYQPRQEVQIWFQQGELTSTMITMQRLPVEQFDMSGITTHYFRYDTADGSWSDSISPFPPGQTGVDERAIKDVGSA